jgi:acetyl esterase/lipase
VDQYGGDRDFVAIAACSAGGHLAALAGLTTGDPAFRGELAEDADTSVDGRRDLRPVRLGGSLDSRRNFQAFLERVDAAQSVSSSGGLRRRVAVGPHPR